MSGKERLGEGGGPSSKKRAKKRRGVVRVTGGKQADENMEHERTGATSGGGELMSLTKWECRARGGGGGEGGVLIVHTPLRRRREKNVQTGT